MNISSFLKFIIALIYSIETLHFLGTFMYNVPKETPKLLLRVGHNLSPIVLFAIFPPAAFSNIEAAFVDHFPSNQILFGKK